jgi:uncharacterized protein (AIM24 family)
MTDPGAGSVYRCPYCRTESSGAEGSCPTCGAPVDIRLRTTASGWTELPAIKDMARIQLGQSSCQISGAIVPFAELSLAAGDGVTFPHECLLWQEPAVEVSAMPLRRAWNRVRAGLPIVMLQARGPGRIAFSHNTAGELLAVPLQPGASVDVCEHHLVACTLDVDYDWVDSGVWFSATGEQSQDRPSGSSLLRLGLDLIGDDDDSGGDGDRNEVTVHYPVGRQIDRFRAGDRPGLVLVQVGGNAFQRELAEGENILIKPPALLFKDPTVAMQLHVEYPSAGIRLWRSWGNRYLWLRLWGPGRVAVQSSYERLEDPGTDFQDCSPYTQQAW